MFQTNGGDKEIDISRSGKIAEAEIKKSSHTYSVGNC